MTTRKKSDPKPLAPDPIGPSDGPLSFETETESADPVPTDVTTACPVCGTLRVGLEPRSPCPVDGFRLVEAP